MDALLDRTRFPEHFVVAEDLHLVENAMVGPFEAQGDLVFVLSDGFLKIDAVEIVYVMGQGYIVHDIEDTLGEMKPALLDHGAGFIPQHECMTGANGGPFRGT